MSEQGFDKAMVLSMIVAGKALMENETLPTLGRERVIDNLRTLVSSADTRTSLARATYLVLLMSSVKSRKDVDLVASAAAAGTILKTVGMTQPEIEQVMYDFNPYKELEDDLSDAN